MACPIGPNGIAPTFNRLAPTLTPESLCCGFERGLPPEEMLSIYLLTYQFTPSCQELLDSGSKLLPDCNFNDCRCVDMKLRGKRGNTGIVQIGNSGDEG